MAAWLYMGGYWPFVWGAYGIVAFACTVYWYWVSCKPSKEDR